MAPCFHEAVQGHNGPLAPWVPQCHNGLHDYIGPCNGTMVSMDPQCPVASHGPLAAQGPGMQQWPLGSTKPLGTMGPSSATMMSLVPQCPHTVTMTTWFHREPRVSPWSLQEGNHRAPVFQELMNCSHQRPRPVCPGRFVWEQPSDLRKFEC